MARLKPISKNLNAFLDMLAFAEGTSTSPITKDDGYDVIVTGVNGPEITNSYVAHPFANGRQSKVINSHGLTSNASGRYQFMLKDYEHYKRLLNLYDFGPISQDRWAIQLIKERGALPLIEAGNLEAAVTRCANLWASLPGAGYGQREHKFNDLQAVYIEKGGTLWKSFTESSPQSLSQSEPLQPENSKVELKPSRMQPQNRLLLTLQGLFNLIKLLLTRK